MTSTAMPFDQPTGGTDLQAIMAILTAQAARMDRIEARLDRIIDAQHSQGGQTSIPIPQFMALTIMATVAVAAILVAIYYGGNAG